jgi:hypothetical protein
VHERIVKPIACWRRQGIQHAAALYSERHSLRSIAQKSPHFPAAKKKKKKEKKISIIPTLRTSGDYLKSFIYM